MKCLQVAVAAGLAASLALALKAEQGGGRAGGPSRGRLAVDNAPAAPPSPATVSTREFVVSYPFDGLLQGANLTAPSYKVGGHDEAAAASGVDDYPSRRVVITVRPR